jgi:uncharacterized protein YdaU (DUF1376 family)
MHYYPFNIGDYRSDTGHLSWDEKHVYRELLDWSYLDEKPLPLDIDLICRKLAAKTDSQMAAVRTVLEEFFEKTSEGYTQGRVLLEIKIYSVKADAARLNGKRGGRPKKNPEVIAGLADQNPSVIAGLANKTQPKANQELRTKNQELLTKNEGKEVRQGADAPLSSSKKNDGVPPCPHAEILSLWKQHLPNLVQPKAGTWQGARRKALEARWAWSFKNAVNDDGTKRVTSLCEGLAYFEKVFKYASNCPHLMGENDRGWTMSLDWLVKEANFYKVIEGNYEGKPQA